MHLKHGYLKNRKCDGEEQQIWNWKLLPKNCLYKNARNEVLRAYWETENKRLTNIGLLRKPRGKGRRGRQKKRWKEKEKIRFYGEKWYVLNSYEKWEEFGGIHSTLIQFSLVSLDEGSFYLSWYNEMYWISIKIHVLGLNYIGKFELSALINPPCIFRLSSI